MTTNTAVGNSTHPLPCNSVGQGLLRDLGLSGIKSVGLQPGYIPYSGSSADPAPNTSGYQPHSVP